MRLPVYTELSNFSVRKGGKKITADLTVVLFIGRLSDPVDAINSVYGFLSRVPLKCEFIIITADREGYKFDRLLTAFPILRVLLPQGSFTLAETINLAVNEALAPDILFLDEKSSLDHFESEIVEMYLKEANYGMVIPLLQNAQGETVPNIVKGGAAEGFIRTITRDIIGTAVSSLYPKYFCFILNRDAFQLRGIELSEYADSRYTLLELGYRLWKAGFVIVQVRDFRAVYKGIESADIEEDISSPDYLAFNFSNVTDEKLRRVRRKRALSAIMKNIFSFRFQSIGSLWAILRDALGRRKDSGQFVVEDQAIFAILNRDVQ